MRVPSSIALAALLLAVPAAACHAKAGATAKVDPAVCADCMRADMDRLASPDMRGRECGTADEARAAAYVESRLKEAHVTGAFAGEFLQRVGLSTATMATAPTVKVDGVSGVWANGGEIAVVSHPVTASGPLLRLSAAQHNASAIRGAVIFDDVKGGSPQVRASLYAQGAVAVLQPGQPGQVKYWAQVSDGWKSTEVQDAPSNAEPGNDGPRVLLKPEAAAALATVKDGATVHLDAQPGAPMLRTTQNVVGVIHGTDPDADRHAVLLSAHYDHLGVRDGVLYPGADDDASGSTAVLEFARLIGKGVPPRRTVYFALFACEEEGGLGATYFRAHPPMALSDFAANLEFEMIGLRDPKHRDTLMLTGWERSNLGPTLAAHGARLGPDPYPEEHFFQRSDNYELALKGVVAQTVGGWPIPPTYHQPTDTLASVDVDFMVEVVSSMAAPVKWLLNSDFTPQWNPGQRP